MIDDVSVFTEYCHLRINPFSGENVELSGKFLSPPFAPQS